MRKTISNLVENCPEFYVIGRARNGLDAIEKVKRLKPDLITLDIEMPELNGLDTLRIIMEENPIPVVMLSNGSNATLEAYELGAVDFVLKEDLVKEDDLQKRNDFFDRLKAAAGSKPSLPIIKNPVEPSKIVNKVIGQTKENKEFVVIGSSTGGPSALQTILTNFPSDFSLPILVIQHMPPGFTKPLAERFDGLCRLNVKEAEHNEVLLPGTIYIAPAGLQTTVQKNEANEPIIRLKISAGIDTLYKPSVDVALLSVAPLYLDKLLTVILTGMGDDGLRGCKSVRQHGGTILTESEQSCIVYGMPKVVYEAGLSDQQAPLQEMYELMRYYIART